MTKNLKNKPLVEALFVLKWDLKKVDEGSKEGYAYDPYYKLFIGCFWEKIKEKFPHFEELDTSEMPEDFGAYVPQFRFSKTADNYPFVLLGPGVISVHESEDYLWDNFEDNIFLIIDSFYKSYPKADDTAIVDVYLRYTDAISFDYQKENILNFLKDQMKINISVSESVFKNTSVKSIPLSIDLRFSFVTDSPISATHLRFYRGGEHGELLMWETIVQAHEMIPQTEGEIKTWTIKSHDLADKVFFNIIEGKLEERFS
ncbi:MAG: TIGR04255 family protein [Candidatus Marinimicrobia bacterium]|nr:TIGR04255 family protein [Candidatus Neomarinimicrobiota bacterium]